MRLLQAVVASRRWPHILRGGLVTQRLVEHGKRSTVEYPDGGADRYGKHCRLFGVSLAGIQL